MEVIQEVEGERLKGALEWLVAAVKELQARPAPVDPPPPPPDHTEEIERLKAQARDLEAAVEELRGGVAAADAKAAEAGERAETADARAGEAGARAEAAEVRVAAEAARLDADVAALREAQEQAEAAAALLAERVDTKAEQADLEATCADLARGLARVDAAEEEIVKLWEAIRACEARLDNLVIPEPLPPLPPVEIPLPPAGDEGGVDFGALLRPLQEAIASNRQALEALSTMPARVDRTEAGLGGLAKRVAALEGDVATLAGGDMQEKANLADLPVLPDAPPAPAPEAAPAPAPEAAPAPAPAPAAAAIIAPAAEPTDLSGLEAAVAELREGRDALRRDVTAAFEDLEVKRVDIEELRAMLEGKADLDALSTLKMHFAGLSAAGGEGPTGAGELNSGMLDAFQDALASKADKELVNVSLDQLWAEVRACQKNVRQAREEVERVREEEVRPLYDRADAADRALEGLEERKADRSRVRKDLEERADLEDHLALRDEVAALKLLLASLRPDGGGRGGDGGGGDNGGGMLDALNAAMATKADRTTADTLAEDLEALREAYMAHLSSTEDEGSHVRLLKAISDLWEALHALQDLVEGLPLHGGLVPAEPASMGSLSADASMELLPEWTNRFKTMEDALRSKPEKEELKVVLKELAGVRKKLNEVSAPRVRVKRVVPRGNKAILSGKPLSGYRCMGCDRPLGKLVQVPGPFVPTNILDNHFKDHTPVHAAGWRGTSPKKRAGRGGAGGGRGGAGDGDEDEDEDADRGGGRRTGIPAAASGGAGAGGGSGIFLEASEGGLPNGSSGGGLVPGGEGPGGALSPLTPSNSSLLPQLSPSPTSSPDPEPSDFLLPAQRSYLKKPSTAAARIYQTLPSRAISPSKTQPRAAFGPNLPPGGWHGTGTTPVPTGSPGAPRPGTSPGLPQSLSDKKFPKRSRMKRQKNIASMRQL